MTHGPTRISSRGSCIYCGALAALSDEHVVPYSLGGAHILEAASCHECATITSRFEQSVARDLWGAARISYGARTRRKKERPDFVVLTDPEDSRKTHRLRYSDYPAPIFFYNAPRAGLLEGVPETIDRISAWLPIVIADKKIESFEQTHGFKLTARYRHLPHQFGRLICKVGYCNALTVLDPSDFVPICIPHILGQASNVSFVVGADPEIEPIAADKGYVLRNELTGDTRVALIVSKIRLLANLASPTYHAVVGAVLGVSNIERVIAKLGPGEVCVTGPVTEANNVWLRYVTMLIEQRATGIRSPIT